MRSCLKERKIQNSTLLLFIIQTKKDMIFHLGIVFLTLHYPNCSYGLRHLLGVPSNFFSYYYVLNACISPSNKWKSCIKWHFLIMCTFHRLKFKLAVFLEHVLLENLKRHYDQKYLSSWYVLHSYFLHPVWCSVF